MKHTQRHSISQLVQLQTFQSRQLWHDYSHRRKIIGLKNGGDPSEKLLWHGTSQTDPSMIINSEDGLDHRFSAKGFYGTGIYGAERAEYSDKGYAYKCPGKVNGHAKCKQILLCTCIPCMSPV